MTLEGNADERGSREYNLGLGERRGNAVSSALQANGGSRQPDHRGQLRRRTPGLQRLDRRLLGQEPSRRDRLHGEVSDAHAHRPSPLLALAAALVAAAPAFAQARQPGRSRRRARAAGRATTRATSTCSTRSRSCARKCRRCASQLEEAAAAERAAEAADHDQYAGDLDARLSAARRRRRCDDGAGASAGQRIDRVRAAPPAAAERPPTVRGDAGRVAQSADERTAYDAAFDALKAGDYVQSARSSRQFLRDYPGRHATRRTRCTGSARATTSRRTTSWRRNSSRPCSTATRRTTRPPGALLKVGLSQLRPEADGRRGGHPGPASPSSTPAPTPRARPTTASARSSWARSAKA